MNRAEILSLFDRVDDAILRTIDDSEIEIQSIDPEACAYVRNQHKDNLHFLRLDIHRAQDKIKAEGIVD